ncbi:CHAP domain-containing protein [Flavobacterium sp. Fl-77]|uniref:CHAP domain-containing protein n=1 Tax=Flavobacterium flavipigmentatum TaxID=2893884 RepID=A0AAJ2VYB1_9FLAO|nr:MULTISPECIES: CHAP domain-containing protein [unclassified Flavobacterium]MDX6182595.1 CHAP domain-containing protein [Flavobacterium sp. Fl-33]MDX6186225.1 CHAP domain-containing protein [Flavobacterium sp. Fl-77]UFH38372.1 CHAP domain-containing protein [Flavobacterium sp. F-70]
MTLAQKTLEIAIAQIGVEEMPKYSNSGPEVEIYLKSVGLTRGYSWCMAFVFWCTQNAALQTKFKNPLKKTGGVLDQYNSRPLLIQKVPQVGDIFILDLGKGLGHTGIVEKVTGNIIHTIEGNTNDTGSREGYKVCRRRREIKTMKGFLRL